MKIVMTKANDLTIELRGGLAADKILFLSKQLAKDDF